MSLLPLRTIAIVPSDAEEAAMVSAVDAMVMSPVSNGHSLYTDRVGEIDATWDSESWLCEREIDPEFERVSSRSDAEGSAVGVGCVSLRDMSCDAVRPRVAVARVDVAEGAVLTLRLEGDKVRSLES